jgi:hypothetical protein
MSSDSLQSALAALVLRPRETLFLRWNWKTAVLSSLARGGLFFLTNLPSGLGAAAGALMTEFALRGATSGFYGAVTQNFRRVEPPWCAFLAVFLLLPLGQHALEFAVHLVRGTPRLGASILASAGFTVLSTAVNLHLMRKGLLVVGDEGRSLLHDLGALPRVAREFLVSAGAACRRLRWTIIPGL